MSYFTLGWLQLIGGGVLFATGSIASTFGWNRQADKEKRAWHQRWWSLVTIGFLLAGGGGVLATWGWNNIDKQGQRDALIFALCKEINYNRYFLLHDPIVTNDPYDGTTPRIFSLFETSAMQQLYTSGIVQDPTLTRLCWSYTAIAHHCNEYFRLYNVDLTRAGTKPSERIEKIKAIASTFGPLKDFQNCQRGLVLHLQQNYGEAMSIIEADEDFIKNPEITIVDYTARRE